MWPHSRKLAMPKPDQALPGRNERMPVPAKHFVNGNPLVPPFPAGTELAMFGLGCFWGAERKFWPERGVFSTAAGYAAGYTPNPDYEEVCSGLTGHNEVVRVVFDPTLVSYERLLRVFWESHDPTQGMRQGNDVGTHRPSSGHSRKRRATPISAYCRRRASAGSPPRSSTRPSSTTPRTITSSTSRRTRAGTAASAAPGSRARSGSRRRRVLPSFASRASSRAARARRARRGAACPGAARPAA